jgi:hypothetical protein
MATTPNLSTLVKNYKQKINSSIIEQNNPSIQNTHSTNNYLFLNGEKLDLNEWITISEYKTRYNLESTNVVSNWIRRGKIPSENIKRVPTLALTLIYDMVYN